MDTWNEKDTDTYERLAPVAVPARAEQIAVLVCLVPFRPRETFTVVELGCGRGALGATLLECFPHASLLALDGSAEMREAARKTLAPFGARARVQAFELTATEWYASLVGAGCVVSSLCLHHLDAADKRTVFAETARHLTPEGALLIADLIEPQRPEARALFADTWDLAAEEAALATTGSRSLFELFEKTEWNHFRYPDPVDRPSPLVDQLVWLRQAGFAAADCFWARAGHAIYGGYMSAASSAVELSFARALDTAKKALVTSE